MPYIPLAHKKYNMLPYCTANGGEVFSYDSDLVNELEQIFGNEYSFIPYGYMSYDEFYNMLENIYAPDLVVNRKIISFKENIIKRNVKENWSIAKYIGTSTDSTFGLTQNRFYYFPCYTENIAYEGIIDDEEFTSYISYPLLKELWIIAEDPLGLLKNILE